MTLDEAVEQLEVAKREEALARQARINAETALIALVENKQEGSITARGGQYKATVTFSVNRTLDASALEAVRGSIPPALFEQAVAYKPEIILAGLRYIQNNEPETYAVLAQAITAKPAKPSVKIEPLQMAIAA